jgi:hypothetical protein
LAITVEHEKKVDYEESARLVTQAVASRDVIIQSEHLRWFYERCFSLGTTVVALRDGNRKIGQFAMVRQTILVNGKEESAAQLVDLFVSHEYRGKERLYQLYNEVERQFVNQDIRFAIGMPNAKAIRINEHFFKLKPFLRLPLSMGVALPLLTQRDLLSFRFDPANNSKSLALFARFRSSSDENGLTWDETKLFERLCGKRYEYGVHAVEELLLISSPRTARGVNYTLLCGFMAHPGAEVTPRAVRSLVRSACHMWGRPLFLYAGINNKLPSLPGIAFPDKIRPSPMLIQLRDFKPDRPPLRLDRFQLFDFDFA